MKFFIRSSLILSVFFSLSLAGIALARDLSGLVVYVADGDTITVRATNGERVKVRLSGIDCPESAWEGHWTVQPYSGLARSFTNDMVYGKRVQVKLTNDETYGRLVGEVFLNGESLNRALLRAGLAWWNKFYAPDDYELKRLEREARKARKGLWKDNYPKPPWVHRRGR